MHARLSKTGIHLSLSNDSLREQYVYAKIKCRMFACISKDYMHARLSCLYKFGMHASLSNDAVNKGKINGRDQRWNACTHVHVYEINQLVKDFVLFSSTAYIYCILIFELIEMQQYRDFKISPFCPFKQKIMLSRW